MKKEKSEPRVKVKKFEPGVKKKKEKEKLETSKDFLDLTFEDEEESE
jgi:hypothetical protein